MKFILHHPNGTLILTAQDKEQVFRWSQRQLGKKALLVSITEKEFSEMDGFVEKDGTGITSSEVEGCKPMISIMANFVQNLSDAKESHMESDGFVSGPRLNGMKPTVH